MNHQPTVASLWGGIGGGLLGFCFADYKPIWMADDRDFVKREWMIQSWEGWLKSTGRWVRGQKFPFWTLDSETLELPDLPTGLVVDVLIGSPPCKRFSSLAVRKKDRLDFNPHDLEYIKFLKAVDVLQPKAFVLENLVSISKHFEWNYLIDTPIISEVGSAGYILSLPEYEVRSFIINSVHHGVPQKRNRLYVVGIKKELVEYGFPHISLKKSTEERTVRDAFKDIKDAPNMEVSNHSQKRIDGFHRLEPGQSYYGTQNNKRIHIDRPGPTITSHRTQYVHPFDPRTLTVRECARLMGFPDTFEFFGPRTKQLDQVGCGITPAVAYHIARSLEACLKSA